MNNRKVPYSGGTFDTHDAAGNVVESEFSHSVCASPCRDYDDTKKWRFDAAGRLAYFEHTGPWEVLPHIPQTQSDETTFDGDGRAVKVRSVNEHQYYDYPWYYIYSSVTGQKITDIIDNYRVATHIYMGDSIIAEEYSEGEEATVAFNLTDPVTGSVRKTDRHGVLSPEDPDGIYPTRVEMAGLGMSVPLSLPPAYPLPPRRHGAVGDAEGGCIVYVDGFEARRWNCSPTDLAGADTSLDPVRQQTGWKVNYDTSNGKVTRHFSMSETRRMLGMLEGGERITSTWSIFASSATFLRLGSGQQRSAGEGDYVDPHVPLEDFLKKNPNCLKAINELGKRLNLKDFETVMEDTIMLANSFDERGRRVGNDPVFGREEMQGLKRSFGQYQMAAGGRIIYGRTTYGPAGPTIWIANRGMNPYPEDIKMGITVGSVVYHEGVHRYLFDARLNSHENIVRELGIDLIADVNAADGKPYTADGRASESFHAWIARGCKNKGKK